MDSLGGLCGLMVSSAVKTVVPANGKALVALNIAIAVPPGTYGRVAPRSGLGASSYRPAVHPLMSNGYHSFQVLDPHGSWRDRR